MTEIPKPDIRVDICIATYRRPEMLTRLLESITGKISIPEHVQLEVIVADNDKEQSARPVVDAVLKESSIPIHYLIEPEKNIAKVRNKAINASQADFILFIDDDEYPDELWLAQLLNTAHTYNADVVFGPVISVFHENCPTWVKLGGFFKHRRYKTGTKMGTGATNNTLIKRSLVGENATSLDESFGRTGGSDTRLFLSLAEQGANLVWCDEAIVYEEVIKNRVTISWLVRRSYRSGQVAGRILISTSSFTGKLYWALKRFIFLSLSAIALPFSLLLGKAIYVKVMQKIAANIGHVTALSGRYYEEYGVNK